MASEIVDTDKKEVQVGVQELSFNKERVQTDDSAQAPRVLSVGKVEKYWLVEAGACFVALAALLAIVGILYKYDDRPVPSSLIPPWHIKVVHREVTFHWTLSINSVISLFSTTYNLALLIPVGACMAQLKWTWFSKGNKLSDFQLIDKSKGTWGSIVLLWKWQCRRLASLGALITLGALALDFAFQSLVIYKPENVPSPIGANVPRRFDYTTAAGTTFGSSYDIPEAMTGAIYTGIYDSTGKHDVTPSCPTGNCTWSHPYASLGICSQCDDITNEIVQSCSLSDDPTSNVINVGGDTMSIGSCIYTLPNGHYIYQNGSTWMPTEAVVLNVTTIGNQSRSEATYGSIQSPLTQYTILRANFSAPASNAQFIGNISLPTVTAAKCMLTFCAKRYNAVVTNGNFQETILSTFINDTAAINDPITSDITNYIINPPASAGYVDSNNNSAQFIVAPYAVDPIYVKFSLLWAGNCTGIGYAFCSTDISKRIFNLDFAAMTSMMANLATVMTNTIRVSIPNGAADNLLNPVPSTDTDISAAGDAHRLITTVRVQWRWLILPALLLGMTIIFLAATAINSAKANMTLWKGHSLAAFTHGLTSSGRSCLTEAKRIKEVEEMAAETKVKWVETEKGGRLVQVE